MKGRKALLPLLLCVVVLLATVGAIDKILLALRSAHHPSRDRFKGYSHCITYTLDTEKWAIYDLPANHGEIRIVTNAIRAGHSAAGDNGSLEYSIKYAIKDSAGRVLREREHSFRSKIRNDYLLESKNVTSQQGPLKDSFLVTEGKLALLNVSILPPSAKELHLKASMDEQKADGVLGRVYIKKRLSAVKKAFRWKRMSKSEKRRTIKYNVYPYDLLTSAEVSEYCTFKWGATAPRGGGRSGGRARVLYKQVGDVVETEETSKEESILSSCGKGESKSG